MQFQPHQRVDVAGGTYSPGGEERSPDGGTGGVHGSDGLPKVSHGASEKQRRDRINGMINELRAIGARGACRFSMPPPSMRKYAALAMLCLHLHRFLQCLATW